MRYHPRGVSDAREPSVGTTRGENQASGRRSERIYAVPVPARRVAGVVLLGAGVIVLLAGPGFLFTSGYRLDVAMLALYLAILSSTWSLLAGVAGQFSFAHAAIAGLAGYSGAIWSRQLFGTSEMLASSGVSIVVGTAFGALVGVALGVLLQRLRGAYFALFTIAFSEVARLVIVAESQVTGGRRSLAVAPDLPGDELLHYYVMIGVLVAVLAVIYLLLRSRLGLNLRAMREDHEAAAAMGVNVARLKFFIMVFTSVLIAVSASVYFHIAGRMVPENLDLILMSQVIAYAVIGGLESPAAAAVGAMVFSFILEGLRDLEIGGVEVELGVWRLAVFGAILVLTLRFAPNGLFAPLIDYFSGADVARRRTVAARDAAPGPGDEAEPEVPAGTGGLAGGTEEGAR